MATSLPSNPLSSSTPHRTKQDDKVSDEVAESATESETESDCDSSYSNLSLPCSPQNQLGLPKNKAWHTQYPNAEPSSHTSAVPEGNGDDADSKISKVDVMSEKCKVNISSSHPSEKKIIIQICVEGGSLVNPIFNFNFPVENGKGKKRKRGSV
ncbi:hypothetical protein BDZ94DRAFT_1241823 [Collybia nuda]|uniref:Uncharacterized protein n=1 Tax=Collybia nuda TaxID=64659 RepID=A0A9P5XSI0_9AGAR|nr:hypothetical protein BDZ94DRAFT_1241823 [Collybia nuda]